MWVLVLLEKKMILHEESQRYNAKQKFVTNLIDYFGMEYQNQVKTSIGFNCRKNTRCNC